jgi:hypothetical protein
MRGVLGIVLVVVLAVQFVWGAAASVCRHEQGTGAAHFGHHEHRHAAQSEAASLADRGAGAEPTDDPDCGACHLSCARPVSDPRPVPVGPFAPPRFAQARPPDTAAPPSAIERPQWRLRA